MDFNRNKFVFYPLAKRNLRGGVSIWEIKVSDETGEITISYGQLGSEFAESIYQPDMKNIGKINQTTRVEQGLKEALAKWKSKLNEGYTSLGVLTNNDVHPNLLDGLIIDKNRLYYNLHEVLPDTLMSSNDILLPMKAKTFEIGKMKYPVIGQFKLNGLRAVLRWEEYYKTDELFNSENKAILRTKENNIYDVYFNNVYKSTFDKDIAYDGELYIHNTPLNIIKSSAPMIRKDGIYCKNSRPKENLSFIIFDLSIPNTNQLERIRTLNSNYNLPKYDSTLIKFRLLSESDLFTIGLHIVDYIKSNVGSAKILPSFIIESDEDAIRFLNWSISLGFEGSIFRDMSANYEFGRRCATMQKAKKFTDREFIIVDVIEKTKTSIRSNILMICKNDLNGELFEAVPMGDEKLRQEYLLNKDKYIGKPAIVKFYERSGVKHVPFHGNVVTIRDYE